MEQETDDPSADGWDSTRAAIIRNAAGIGLATGAYALSFGAIAVTTGLSVVQTSFASLLVFTGASQFAFLGVIAAHGSPVAGAATAILLGIRNALYGLRLSPLLGLTALRRVPSAQLVIDETTAMAIAQRSDRAGRFAFWATGAAVYVGWNTGTLLGALGAKALTNPASLGLDAAVPAAFLALLAPRMRSGRSWTVAAAGSLAALIALPLVPAGIPVLLAAAVAASFGIYWAGREVPSSPIQTMRADR